MKPIRSLSLLLLLTPVVAFAWQVCHVSFPTAAFSVPHLAHAPELNTDPHSPAWSHAASAWIVKDCSQQLDYPKLKTEVRAFWTDSDLYRIDGLGEDPLRHFMCWQPTCVENRDPNHVPEHFGTLIFTK